MIDKIMDNIPYLDKNKNGDESGRGKNTNESTSTAEQQ